MQQVTTAAAPTAGGHYSQGIVHGGFVFVAGQLPVVPGQAEHRPGDVESQLVQAMRNVEAILVAGGSSLAKLVSVTIYVTDVAQWGRVNAAYAALMGEHRPARAIVPVPSLHYGYAIEIQAIGAV